MRWAFLLLHFFLIEFSIAGFFKDELSFLPFKVTDFFFYPSRTHFWGQYQVNFMANFRQTFKRIMFRYTLAAKHLENLKAHNPSKQTTFTQTFQCQNQPSRPPSHHQINYNATTVTSFLNPFSSKTSSTIPSCEWSLIYTSLSTVPGKYIS